LKGVHDESSVKKIQCHGWLKASRFYYKQRLCEGKHPKDITP